MNDESNHISIGQEPNPTVWPPPPTHLAVDHVPSPLNSLDELRSQSVMLIILFTFLSLGVYSVVWLSQQAGKISRLKPEMKTSSGFVIAALCIAIASAGMDVAGLIISNVTLDQISNVVDKVYLVVLIILTFGVRNRLNSILEARPGDRYWFSGGWTFWFGVAYLQYKINKNIQLWQRERVELVL